MTNLQIEEALRLRSLIESLKIEIEDFEPNDRKISFICLQLAIKYDDDSSQVVRLNKKDLPEGTCREIFDTYLKSLKMRLAGLETKFEAL